MGEILLIDDEQRVLELFERTLQTVGYSVVPATSGSEALTLLAQRNIDLIIVDLQLPDISGLDVLRHVRLAGRAIPVVVVTGVGGTADAVAAMRLGAADFLEKPTDLTTLVQTVNVALQSERESWDDGHIPDSAAHEPHAAARWARALVPLLNAPKDPRTIAEWSHIVFVSAGALRNWCQTTGIAPRRSLVFGRLLRAAHLSQQRSQRLENLLDVVDRRTLVGLLREAGMSPADFPMTAEDFVARQSLVRDRDALAQIRRALEDYRRARQPRVACRIDAG